MATIKEDFVSFEIAKLLKEKGFDWECSMYYDIEEIKEMEEDGDLETPEPEEVDRESLLYDYEGIYIKAPTLQMAMQWLREEHNLSVEPYYYLTWRYCIKTITDLKFAGEGKDFDTYYQAAEASIRYCLDNLI